MAIKWREQLSVGNDVIDSDHQYLITIINQVEQYVEDKNPAGLTSAFENLVKYSKLHFAREEEIATAIGYAQTISLQDSHYALIDKLEHSKLELGDKWTLASVERFTALLRSWLIDHIIKEDLLMKPSLAKFSPKFDPRMPA